MSAASRRRELVLLACLGLVLGGALLLLALRPRSWTAWLVAAGALANLVVAVALRRSRRAA